MNAGLISILLAAIGAIGAFTGAVVSYLLGHRKAAADATAATAQAAAQIAASADEQLERMRRWRDQDAADVVLLRRRLHEVEQQVVVMQRRMDDERTRLTAVITDLVARTRPH